MNINARTRSLICCRPPRGLVESYLFVDLGFRCASPQGGVEHLGWGARLYAVTRYRGLVDGSARAALLVNNKHILKELWQAAKNTHDLRNHRTARNGWLDLSCFMDFLAPTRLTAWGPRVDRFTAFMTVPFFSSLLENTTWRPRTTKAFMLGIQTSARHPLC